MWSFYQPVQVPNSVSFEVKLCECVYAIRPKVADTSEYVPCQVEYLQDTSYKIIVRFKFEAAQTGQ